MNITKFSIKIMPYLLIFVYQNKTFLFLIQVLNGLATNKTKTKTPGTTLCNKRQSSLTGYIHKWKIKTCIFIQKQTKGKHFHSQMKTEGTFSFTNEN